MDDTISRQAAIDALDAICDRECEYPKKQRAVMCASCHLGSAFDAIDELPSAERRGRWVIKKDVTFPHTVCSECKKPFYGNMDDEWNYCPNCGARMEAEE